MGFLESLLLDFDLQLLKQEFTLVMQLGRLNLLFLSLELSFALFACLRRR